MKSRALLLVWMAVAASGQTGTPVRSLVAYDTFVSNLMTKYNIPGASLAIIR